MKIVICIILVLALMGCSNNDKSLEKNKTVEVNATYENDEMGLELNNNDYVLNNQFIEDTNVLNVSLYKDIKLSIETENAVIMDSIDDNVNLDRYDILMDMLNDFENKAKVICQKLKVTNTCDKKVEYYINNFSLFKVTQKNEQGKNVIDIVENEKFYQIDNDVSSKEKGYISLDIGETKEVTIYYVTIEEVSENDEIYFEATDTNYYFEGNKLILNITKEMQFLKINLNFLIKEGN